jgi:hypothetical protein
MVGIMLGVLIYLILLIGVLAFFAAVGKVNDQWERSLRAVHGSPLGENYRRAA